MHFLRLNSFVDLYKMHKVIKHFAKKTVLKIKPYIHFNYARFLLDTADLLQTCGRTLYPGTMYNV